jgi:hypothetical protein
MQSVFLICFEAVVSDQNLLMIQINDVKALYAQADLISMVRMAHLTSWHQKPTILLA